MENLNKALNTYTAEELCVEKEVVKENLLEPTEAEIKSIINAIKEGKTDKEIKVTVRRFIKNEKGEQVSAQGFSYGQIQEIRNAVDQKAATVVKEVEINEGLIK
jgi:hypothetical protein